MNKILRDKIMSTHALRVPTKQQSYDFMARDQTSPSSFFRCCYRVISCMITKQSVRKKFLLK